MDSIAIFTTALQFEKKIRDLYRSAESIVDDERGKKIFSSLADEEQSHIDFLEESLKTLEKNGTINPELLSTAVPDVTTLGDKIESMKSSIPERMLGDVKSVLNSALKMERETTEYYKDAFNRTEGEIQKVLGRFVEIEQRHTDVVRIELDHAARNGFWFDFMEISMEEG
ncbi:MAG: ferritin family protein [Desulfopila sp.]|jgi:rubrerythrin|nr:ferritin family protein [Desulfopila sp.]